ncbi:MAG: lysylphosphatidylglycerol synthase transmembrane domain-containing protein [Actinomycetota bacterium]
MTEEISQPEVSKTPRFGKQQIIASVLTIAILVLVFVVVLPQFGDYDQAWEAIQGMTRTHMVYLVIATIAVIIIYTFPFQAALPGLKFKPAFLTRQTSFMISNVIPAGGAFGLAIQYAMLSGYGYGTAPVTATIGITSVWNTLVTLSFPVIALVLLTIAGTSTGEVAVVTLIAGVIVAAIIIVFALILKSEDTARKVGGWANSIVGRAAGLMHKEVGIDAVDAVVEFRSSIVDVVAERWLIITVSNVGQQLAQFSILYLAVVALQGGFDGPVSLLEAFAAYAFGRLATFIPIPPGGLGTSDAIITAILSAFGLPNNDALAATMIWRAATYFPQVFIGAGALLVWRRGRSKQQPAIA